jgi:putative flippase GtrA
MNLDDLLISFWECKLLRFCMVGAIGFVIDTGVLYMLIRNTGMNPYSARLISLFASATTTYVLNRSFTFSKGLKGEARHREWAIYMVLMLVGGAVNYSVYSLCIAFSRVMYTQPVLAVAAGALAGLALNFSTSRRLFLGRYGA